MKKKVKLKKKAVKETPPAQEINKAPPATKEMLSLAHNNAKQIDLVNKVKLVMAFNPQIDFVDGHAFVLIGPDKDAMMTEGSSVLNAMIKMFDHLTE